MDHRGILIVVSGFSGVGKGTLIRALTGRYSQYALSISATTREQREGEIEGKDYFFRTREEFDELISQNRLIEYAVFCDNYYGTPKDYVEENLSKGHDVILEIECQGALKVKQEYPDTLMIFIMPPDISTLLVRLRGRGTENNDIVQKRLRRALEESKQAEKYDYMIINDDLDRAVEEVHSLIESQHRSVARNLDFIGKIRSELDNPDIFDTDL